MSDVVERAWLRRRGLRRIVDGSTWLVVLLWGGIFAFIPDRPAGIPANMPVQSCMIAVSPMAIADIPLSLRPDLITLPSAVSFGAEEPLVDALYGVPPFQRRAEAPPPFVAAAALPVEDALNTVSLRTDVAETIGNARLPDVWSIVENSAFPVSSTGLHVICSSGLEKTVLKPDAMEIFSVSGDVKQVEVELWVQFDAAGHPVEIFLEKCSAPPAAGQALVRRLWNPASWIDATGQGRVSIWYLPRTGGLDANTNDNLDAGGSAPGA